MTAQALANGILQTRLDGVAAEMGAVLVRAASSPNIAEREDCSCALFAPGGELLAQAAHIPVHIGSMQHAVDAVRAVAPTDPRAGDAWLLNDPYAGGTHLPDITVVVPLSFAGQLVGWAAVRAHHADVGATSPGSMDPFAATIEEEGVRIPATQVRHGEEIDVELLASLVNQVRQPSQRHADLRAQLAAADVAARRVDAIIRRIGGVERWLHACALLLDISQAGARSALALLGPCHGHGSRRIELADGAFAHVAVDLNIEHGIVTADLRASSPQVPGSSLNCPRPVTEAALQFAVRSTLLSELELVGTLARSVQVLTTPGSVVDAAYPAAVSGGNVEVSSVIVDAALAAISNFADVQADGQGTMNNLVLANERFSWYETIAGGQGGSSARPGASAVHVAMTNTRSTPAEIAEQAWPVVVELAQVRRGSGGVGVHRGGDGIVRRIRVLESCELTFAGQRHVDPPRGRAGGGDGLTGRLFVNGEPAPGLTRRSLSPGDIVEVHTPGGGGWGSPVAATSPHS